jgi:hypothetical protein
MMCDSKTEQRGILQNSNPKPENGVGPERCIKYELFIHFENFRALNDGWFIPMMILQRKIGGQRLIDGPARVVDG